VRRAFWVSSEPAEVTFAALRSQLLARAQVGREMDITVHHPPVTIAFAYLSIKVVNTGDGHSAVGAYAAVLAQPPRPAAEHVPLSVDTVKVVDVKEALSGRGVTRRVRTVRAWKPDGWFEFDALRAEPRGLGYAAVGSREGITARFRSAGHRWQASLGDWASVTRDGHPLPNLSYDRAFAQALMATLR
jgi:hypothetical protein